MTSVRHVLRVAMSTLRFAVSTRTVTPIAVLLLGGLIVALAAASTAAAPFVLYPFL